MRTLNSFRRLRPLCTLSFSTCFSARTHWQGKEQKYSAEITSGLYSAQDSSSSRPKTWTNLDNPLILVSKEPYLEIFLNKVLQDITNRYKMMQGDSVKCLYGVNGYGLQVVETLQGTDFLAKSSFDPIKLRQQCRDYVSQALGTYRAAYSKWGILCDSNSCYSTLDKEYEFAVLEGFSQLWKHKSVFRSQRPLFWSVARGMALEELEMEEKKETRDCFFTAFDIVKSVPTLKSRFPEAKLVVYVKEPWKLIGIQGLVANKDIVYNVVELNKTFYVLGKQRAREAIARFGTAAVKVRATFTGEDLMGVTVKDPLFGRELKLYDYVPVNEKYGSGIEPVCPAHDVEGMMIATEYADIPTVGHVEKDGTIDSVLGAPYAGVSCVSEAGNQLLETRLKEAGRVVWQAKGENMFSAEKVTGQRVVLRTVPAWFVRIPRSAKAKVLRDATFTKCVPQLERKDFEKFKIEAEKEYREREKKLKKTKGKKTKQKSDEPQPILSELCHHQKSYYVPFIDTIESMPDFCISEQNPWSIPIPCFAHKSTKELFMNPAVISHVAGLFREKGSDFWFSASVPELLPSEFQGLRDQLEKTHESFNPAFINAMAPHYSRTRLQRRSDFAVECYDQHDEWVSNAAVTTSMLGHKGGLPFTMLKTHGKIVDDFGDPIKSLVYPVDIIDGSVKIDGERKFGLGTDVLRVWASVNDTASDITLKEKHLDEINRKVKGIRTVFERASFVLKDYHPNSGNKSSEERLSLLDEFAVARLDKFASDIKAHYESYVHTQTFESISGFVTSFFSDYVHIVASGHTTPAAKYVVRKSLENLALILHPIAPYTAAELLEFLGKRLTAEELIWPAKIGGETGFVGYTFELIESLFALRKLAREMLDSLKRSKNIKDWNEVELVLVGRDVKETDGLGCSLASFFGVEKAETATNASIGSKNTLKIARLPPVENSKLPVFEVHIMRRVPSKEQPLLLSTPAEGKQ